ncbi:MAG: dinuclear metal center YbgI/SA1388 family protein [Verrucomicrobiales bacterium]|jgi:dinuclear metal center YbgI/SA1388 family protein
MAELSQIVDHTNALLRVAEVPDYPPALNGLQLESQSGQVTKIVAAVDACLPVIEQAIALDADLLVVHHGLFWSGAQKLVGGQFRKLQIAIESGLAIYSAHIPLDIHDEFGNNALMAKALGFEGKSLPILPWKGIHMGRLFETDQTRDALTAKVSSAVGASAHLCPGGPEIVKRVGLCTGGAGSEIASAAAGGVDTFITGEGQHWTYTLAEELGVNLIYGGHYATETFGVKALSAHLAEKFGVAWEFVDHPTGL